MSASNDLKSLNYLVWTAIMAALVAVGAWVTLPIGTVPFSMQPLFVMLAGLILGPVYGAISLGLYLVAGVLGLPIFSGGKSGLAHLMGPTGGYLIGYVFQAALTGLAKGKTQGAAFWVKGVVFGLLGLAAVYGLGVAWLKYAINVDWAKAVTLGFAPFIAPDMVKLALALVIYRFLAAKRLLPA